MKSNILIGSNILKFDADNPLNDEEFVNEIQDYDVLKKIEKYVGSGARGVRFNKKQEQILRTELRCIYAKNDPCWGYNDELKRIVSACINESCPKINECNKNYSAAEAAYWHTENAERQLYGNPQKQEEYYFVDLISDAEMKQYEVEPQNDGLEYPTIKNPVIADAKSKHQSKTKIDPITGRKMVVIGRRWAITDNSDYEGEEIVDIWGYVDDVTERKVKRGKKAKRLERIEAPKAKKTLRNAESSLIQEEIPDYENKAVYENKVSQSIIDEVKLTEISESYEEGTKWQIVLANPAEKAYVSSMLMIDELQHGFNSEENIQLVLIKDFNMKDGAQVFMSDFLLKNGCQKSDIQGWKRISEVPNIIKVNVSNRDYFNFTYGDNLSRWTCRNMYGVTHVCVNDSDIVEIDENDGVHSVSLVEDKDSFMILRKDGMPIGKVGTSFTEVINALVDDKQIEGHPAVIKGIYLNVKNGSCTVLGMGHLKFIEY